MPPKKTQTPKSLPGRNKQTKLAGAPPALTPAAKDGTAEPKDEDVPDAEVQAWSKENNPRGVFAIHAKKSWLSSSGAQVCTYLVCQYPDVVALKNALFGGESGEVIGRYWDWTQSYKATEDASRTLIPTPKTYFAEWLSKDSGSMFREGAISKLFDHSVLSKDTFVCKDRASYPIQINFLGTLYGLMELWGSEWCSGQNGDMVFDKDPEDWSRIYHALRFAFGTMKDMAKKLDMAKDEGSRDATRILNLWLKPEKDIVSTKTKPAPTFYLNKLPKTQLELSITRGEVEHLFVSKGKLRYPDANLLGKDRVREHTDQMNAMGIANDFVAQAMRNLPQFTDDPAMQARLPSITWEQTGKLLEAGSAKLGTQDRLYHPATLLDLEDFLKEREFLPVNLQRQVNQGKADFDSMQSERDAFMKRVNDIVFELLEHGDTAVDWENCPVPEESIRIMAATNREKLMYNDVSAPLLTFEKACQRLHIDPADRLFPPPTFVPLIEKAGLTASRFPLGHGQVIGVAFLVHMLNGPLRSAGLSDDMGLGKTISAIAAHTWIALDLEKRRLSGDSLRHVAKVVVCPSGAIHAWRDDLMNKFPYIAYKTILPPQDVPNVNHRGHNLNKAEDFTAFMSKLDPAELSTGMTWVLAKMDTLATRAMWDDARNKRKNLPLQIYSKADLIRRKRAIAWRATGSPEYNFRSGAVLTGDVDSDEPEDEVMESLREHLTGQKPKRSTYTFEGVARAVNIFDQVEAHVVIDEAHNLKGLLTRRAQAVLGMTCQRSCLLVSGTLMSNRADDLIPLCAYYRRPDLPVPSSWRESEHEAGEEDYDGLATVIDAHEAAGEMISALTIEKFRHLIDPFVLEKVTGQDRVDKEMNLKVSKTVMNTVLRFTGIRRHTANRIQLSDGTKVHVGGDVPPKRVLTVELTMDAAQRQLHYTTLRDLLNAQAQEKSTPLEEDLEEPPSVSLSSSGHRRNCLIPTMPLLDPMDADTTFTDTYAAMTKEKMPPWQILYERMTVTKLPLMPLPCSRAWLLDFLTTYSVKMSALVFLIHQVVFVHGRKLVIFNDWPLGQWLIETMLVVIGIKTGCIRAEQSFTVRESILSAFNTIGSDTRCLVCSSRIGGSSLNIQHAASDIVSIDFNRSIQTMNQMAHRVARKGQTHECRIINLSVDLTYDQRQKRMAYLKMLPIMVSQMSSEDVQDEMRAHMQVYTQKFPGGDAALANKFRAELKPFAIREVAGRYVRDIVGMRSAPSHPAWGWIISVTRKDLLRGERAYDPARKLQPTLTARLDQLMEGSDPDAAVTMRLRTRKKRKNLLSEEFVRAETEPEDEVKGDEDVEMPDAGQEKDAGPSRGRRPTSPLSDLSESPSASSEDQPGETPTSEPETPCKPKSSVRKGLSQVPYTPGTSRHIANALDRISAQVFFDNDPTKTAIDKQVSRPRRRRNVETPVNDKGDDDDDADGHRRKRPRTADPKPAAKGGGKNGRGGKSARKGRA